MFVYAFVCLSVKKNVDKEIKDRILKKDDPKNEDPSKNKEDTKKVKYKYNILLNYTSFTTPA